MRIHLNVAHTITPLALQMAKDLHKPALTDPFTPQWIVTQTEGMNSWLRQKLAKENGIASNIRFDKPNDIVNRIYYLIDQEKLNAIDTETLKWTIYDLLYEDAFKNSFPDIAAYYSENSIRQIAFAGELADIFDQYQVYRFEIIQEWNERWHKQTPPPDWQSWLWIKAKEKLKDQFRDKTEISTYILENLKLPEAQQKIQQRIPALHFFGIAVITPYYLHIFHELAHYIDIYFYLINPAPNDYWMDDKSEIQIARLRKRSIDPSSIRAGNDLLHNWGRIIKESFLLLLSNDAFVNQYEVLSEEDRDPSTLLAKIQNDIHQNANKEERIHLSDSDLQDGSITINGCFTPLREVETLYNYLVELTDQSKEPISPRDILVLVTDIDLYAPYIKAVFQHAPYRFPMTIADETITAENNMFTALQDILALDAHYFKAEDVLKLLDSPYIRKRFQLMDADYVRTAVRQAGIYFSLEGRTEDDTRYISWAYGLKKILYGVCMSGEEEYNDGIDSFIPLDTSEGAMAMERIKLIHFIKMLEDKIIQRQEPKTIPEWAEYLSECMEDLIFAAGEKEDEDYNTFIHLIEQMAELKTTTTAKISFDVFRHSFLHTLKLEKRASAFAGAGITFCSMVPMRSIPYKVVAMMGMNFDKFPRKDTPLSFSLLSKERKPGDRNVKDNDKHLFIETILSAQEKLYISYLAKDAKEGTELPPSSLVDECIDYIARGLNRDTDQLKKDWIHVHPLHSFSKQYDANGSFKNYLSEDRYLTGISITEIKNPEEPHVTIEEIDIKSFTEFFRNPPKTYLNKRFGVYFREDDVLIPDHEKFELDQLDRSIIQSELLKADAADVRQYIQDQKRAGKIPLKNMGEAMVVDAWLEREELRDQIRYEIDGAEEDIHELSLTLGNTRLKGNISSIYGNKLVIISNSSNRIRILLPGFICYAALIASGKQLDFTFLSKKLEPCRIKAGRISQREALDYLKLLVEDYKKGHQSYFLFWPAAGKKAFKHINGTWQEFNIFLEEELENEFSFDMKDDYLNKAIEHGFFTEQRYDEFVRNMLRILGPIRERLPQPFD